MDTFLVVAFLGISLGLTILLVFWAASDAMDRGKSPWLVAIAVVLFFPWGLLAWLLFRPDSGAGNKPRFNLDNYRRG
jgi:hypothetical protein